MISQVIVSTACTPPALPCQALLGLSYMHSRKLIHRDIKSLNLFLDAADNIKVRRLGRHTGCVMGMLLCQNRLYNLQQNASPCNAQHKLHNCS
jgi:serine/threonine protein kinase